LLSDEVEIKCARVRRYFFLSELRNENSLNLNRLRMGSRTSNMAQFIPASSLKIKGLGQKDVLTP